MLELLAWNKETDTAMTPERPPVDLEWARFPNGVKKQYVEPVVPVEPKVISITGITGDLSHSEDFSRATMYEETTATVTGTLLIPDRIFALPIRRNDGRLFVFAAEVVGGAFTVLINFPTCGSFLYSDDECNIDLPPGTFTVAPIRFDVLRVIPS